MSEVNTAGPFTVTEGPFAGWLTWSRGADPFETHVGPFYFRKHPGGEIEAVFTPEPHHCNGGGMIHGGMLMTFADFCLFAIAFDALADDRAVTVSCNSEFLGAAKPGITIRGSGRVTRAAKSLIFVQGALEQQGAPVLAFSGILKKLRANPT